VNKLRVELLNIPYNSAKNVVGEIGETKYDGQVLGTLVLTDNGVWLYHLKGQIGFRIIS
jgi:hypothetical protein